MQDTQNYISEKVKDTTNTYINPATESKQDELINKISQEIQVGLAPFFRNILQSLTDPVCIDKSANQMRVQATVSSGTVTTVSTVSNISTIDSMQGRILMYGQDLNAWAVTVRNTIS